jgi:hypothetical protein
MTAKFRGSPNLDDKNFEVTLGVALKTLRLNFSLNRKGLGVLATPRNLEIGLETP